MFHEAIQGSLGDRRNRIATGTLTLAGLVADAAVFWCMLLAVRADVTFEIAVLAYVAATAVAWVPFVPDGYVLTEVVIPALLHHFGVPYTTGLAAVLLWSSRRPRCASGVWVRHVDRGHSSRGSNARRPGLTITPPSRPGARGRRSRRPDCPRS